MLLPGTDLGGARHVAEIIRKRLEDVVIRDTGVQTSITVSIGAFAAIPSHQDQRKHLLQAADRMLYQAKHSGRNRVEATDHPDDDNLTSPSLSSQTAG